MLFPAIFDTSELNGTTSFIIDGLSTSSNLGHAVSAAQDINLDGITDLIMSAYLADLASISFAELAYMILTNHVPALNSITCHWE